RPQAEPGTEPRSHADVARHVLDYRAYSIIVPTHLLGARGLLGGATLPSLPSLRALLGIGGRFGPGRDFVPLGRLAAGGVQTADRGDVGGDEHDLARVQSSAPGGHRAVARAGRHDPGDVVDLAHALV